MNIGIITWFSYENYGTKLQAIALQKYLRNMGHNVQLLNFTPPELFADNLNIESVWNSIKRQPGKYKAKYIFRKYKKQIDHKHRKMDMFIDRQCKLTKKIESFADYIDVCNSFDLLICGSDQIWNPNLYHKYYFADFEQIKTPRISYAPSLGVNDVLPQVADALKASLNRFDLVTCREKNGADILEKITGRMVPTVLDPTFLLKRNEWEELRENPDCTESYVLCYFLSDNKHHWAAAKAFAKQHRLEMYIIPQQGNSYTQGGRVFPECGVEDFLGLISGAEYILTDSFHGMVFSLIFNKQVYVFERFKEDKYSSQNARVVSLLKNLSLMNRLNVFGSLRVAECTDIEYMSVNKKINQMISESKNILDNGLKMSHTGLR